jgi:hypothetical protein
LGERSRYDIDLGLPKSLVWMESVDEKIERAGEHLAALNTEIFAES